MNSEEFDERIRSSLSAFDITAYSPLFFPALAAHRPVAQEIGRKITILGLLAESPTDIWLSS